MNTFDSATVRTAYKLVRDELSEQDTMDLLDSLEEAMLQALTALDAIRLAVLDAGVPQKDRDHGKATVVALDSWSRKVGVDAA